MCNEIGEIIFKCLSTVILIIYIGITFEMVLLLINGGFLFCVQVESSFGVFNRQKLLLKFQKRDI